MLHSAFSIGVLTASLVLAAQESVVGQGANSPGDIGEVQFNTSCAEEVQADFNHAVALLHHMMYVQAEAAFTDISRQDPSCAMAYWGLAMTSLHPLWAPPTPEAHQRGLAAIKQAKALNTGNDREQAYIDAAAAFFQDWSKDHHRDRLEAWSLKHKRLVDEYPDDVDAAALYALSMLATAPKEDKDYHNQREAGQLLERLRAESPRHPALYHYLIHAYDNPALAAQALEVARDYDKIAPEVPHALHMPTHIFVRLGIWPDTINWNIRSAAAAKRQPAGDAMSLHYFHALDYLMYAYLQQGRNDLAAQVLAQINAADMVQDEFATAYGIAAARARYPLERRQWQEAAQLAPKSHGDFPWQKYPWTESLVHFARGIGAARSGDSAGAAAAARELERLQQLTADAGEEYWAVLVDAQRQTVRAWETFGSGDTEAALTMMRKAADLEDTVDKHPVTPGAVLPARELLGDMLLAAGHPAEALRAFERSLSSSPNRLNSLYGAARAAEPAQQPEKARHYYRKLLKLDSEQNSQRDEFQLARKRLGQS